MNINTNDLLLADRLAPITTSIGFIEFELADIVDQFIAWHTQLLQLMSIDGSVSSTEAVGVLPYVLRKLLPLRMADITRYLFIPTNSAWTAYIDNSYRGTDPAAIGYLAERLKCRTLWIYAAPHTLRKSGVPRRGRQGALIFELYGAEPTHLQNVIRLIRLENDAGKWSFAQHGQPLPFEDLEQYRAKQVRDRFPFETFCAYLENLGITPFSENFYLSNKSRPAILVEKSGDPPKSAKDISLGRARRLNGIEDGLRIFGRLISRNGYF